MNHEARLQMTIVESLRYGLPGDAFVFAALNEESSGHLAFPKVKRWLGSALSAIGARASKSSIDKAAGVVIKQSRTEAALHGAYLKKLGRHTGLADLGICYDGGIIFIELKTEDNEIYGTKRTEQSDDQIAFQRLCEAAGIPYRVCRTLTEVIAFLTECGVPLRIREAA